MVNGCLPQSHLIFPTKICNKNVNDKIMLFNVISAGFIKSTDHQPTDHRPLTHRPTDPIITEPTTK